MLFWEDEMRSTLYEVAELVLMMCCGALIALIVFLYNWSKDEEESEQEPPRRGRGFFRTQPSRKKIRGARRRIREEV
jgi:hypothetical protein